MPKSIRVSTEVNEGWCQGQDQHERLLESVPRSIVVSAKVSQDQCEGQHRDHVNQD